MQHERDWTATDVKSALRRLHHAQGGVGHMVGEWTCVEELWGIDLLAWSAWSRGGYMRVGYEVKVSRSDYRRELLQPKKRTKAMARCHRFYFAVPDGLLSLEELAWREPDDLRPGDFKRVPCPGIDLGGPRAGEGEQLGLLSSAATRHPRYGGNCTKGEYRHGRERKHHVKVPVPAVLNPDAVDRYGFRHRRDDGKPLEDWEIESMVREQGHDRWVCPTCQGRGYIQPSRVEAEAPTLWVPADVGLVLIGPTGPRVVRRAPKMQPRALRDSEIAEAFRWASVRPDPRHHAQQMLASAA